MTNRRAFVRLLILGGGATVLAACQSAPASPTPAPATKPPATTVPAAQPTTAPATAAPAAKPTSAPAAQPTSAAQATAVGQIPQEIIDAAKKDGALTFYGAATQDVYDKIFADFQKAFPEIKVTATRVATSGLKERVMTEFRSGRVQVDLVHASSETADFAEAGAIDPTHVAWEKDMSLAPAPDKLGVVADSLLSRHVVYNTNLLQKADLPKTWQDMLDPKWKGKLALELSSYEWYYALRETMKQARGEDRTKQFFADLAKNVVLREGSTQIMEFLAAGEFPINLDAYGHRYVSFKRDGAPFEIIMPQLEPVALIPSYWFAIKGSPHPNAAKLAQYWILTDAGQAAELRADRIPIAKTVKDSPFTPLLTNVKTFAMHAGDLDYDAVAKEFNAVFKA
jgi:iron(III) transport system substrate-binding protein